MVHPSIDSVIDRSSRPDVNEGTVPSVSHQQHDCDEHDDAGSALGIPVGDQDAKGYAADNREAYQRNRGYQYPRFLLVQIS